MRIFELSKFDDVLLESPKDIVIAKYVIVLQNKGGWSPDYYMSSNGMPYPTEKRQCLGL